MPRKGIFPFEKKKTGMQKILKDYNNRDENCMMGIGGRFRNNNSKY